MTRAMLATVLYRLAGTPTVTADNPFADVGNDYWYTNAILWANQNNIVEGYENDNFGTNDPITREQLATMLYRYAEFNAVDITKTSDISTFVDATQISDYALGAMRWANAEGLVQGKSSTTLNPKEQATRAEVATIFMRFIKNGE
jgi:hypothetical protein